MPDALYPAEPSEQARLRDELLSPTLDRVFAAHPFYRARFAALGIARRDVTGVADLNRLPVTTKADYMADPERFILQAEDTADPSESVVWTRCTPPDQWAGPRRSCRLRMTSPTSSPSSAV